MKTYHTFESLPGQLSTPQTLKLIGWAGLLTFLMLTVPGLSWLNYPCRLLLTIVHELGHGLAAILTGGEFKSFVIYANGGGLAYTAGGWRLVVIPAGYLGTALFGAGLIMLGRNYQGSRLALAIIGGGLMVLSLRYAIPSILIAGQLVGSILATIAGIIFGIILLSAALKAKPSVLIFLLHFIAIQAALTAFFDLTHLIGLSAQLINTQQTDAQSMAELTYIPAIVWAVLWAILTVLLIGGAIWLTWVGPLLREYRETAARGLPSI